MLKKVPVTSRVPKNSDGATLKLGARRMARTLGVWHPRSLTKTQLATLSHIVPGSGTFYNYFRSLLAAGVVELRTGDGVGLTPDAVPQWSGGHAPSSPQEIATQYAGSLKAGARRMLDVLIAAGPEQSLDKRTLATETHVVPGSGTFYNYLRSLLRNGLADDRGNDVVVSPTLFLRP